MIGITEEIQGEEKQGHTFKIFPYISKTVADSSLIKCVLFLQSEDFIRSGFSWVLNWRKENGEKKLNILKIMWFVVSQILKQIKIKCLWDGGIWKIGSESQTPASLVAANIITNSKIIVNSVKIVSYNDITLNIRTLKSSQLFAISYCFQM